MQPARLEPAPAPAPRRGPATFMERLRAHTRASHDQLEETPRLRRLFADDFRLAEYRELLVLMRGFHAPLERQIARAMPAPLRLSLDAGRRLDALDADLRALHLGSPAALPECGRLPDIACVDSALGAQYVLEGSTLGGTVILRQLRARFGEQVAGCTGYYAGHGERTGTMWRHFKNLLESHVAGRAGAPSRVVAAADATFESLGTWLTASHAPVPAIIAGRSRPPG